MPHTPDSTARSASRRPADPGVLQEVALQHFMAVVKTGSVTEAAAKLSVAPSAVSRQIARLERSLDTLLFERRSRGMVLNSAGELLAAHARRAWLDIERVTEDIQGLRGLRSGRVRIAATEGFAYGFLPSLIASFQQQRPGIEFSLSMGTQAEVARQVREGEADLGVTVSLASEPGLEVVLRHASPVLAVMAPTHPLAGRRQLVDISFSRQGLQPRVAFTSDHLYPLINFAAETETITFCGETALRHHLRAGWVVAIPLRDREMSERHFEVQTMARRHIPDAARAFMAHLQASLAE